MRSPGARKSALGSSKLIVSIIGGYEISARSKRRNRETDENWPQNVYVAKFVTQFYSPARLIHGWQRNVHEEEKVVSEDHKLSCEFFSGSAFLVSREWRKNRKKISSSSSPSEINYN